MKPKREASRSVWTFRCTTCGLKARAGPATHNGAPMKMVKRDTRWLTALWKEGWYTEEGLKCPDCKKPADKRGIRSKEELPHLGGFGLMPTPQGTCEQCAVSHSPHEPHNKTSLAYQYWFYGKHGRWPTWEDAWAHCSDEVKASWRAALREKGVKMGAEA